MTGIFGRAGSRLGSGKFRSRPGENYLDLGQTRSTLIKRPGPRTNDYQFSKFTGMVSNQFLTELVNLVP